MVIYHCYSCHVTVICYLYICLCHTYVPHILKLCCLQVRAAETELRHKLFPPNAWIKILNFDVLTSCPKDELHQWFIGLYGEHIVPAIMYRYTQALQRPDLVTLDKNSGNMHMYPIRQLHEFSSAWPTDCRGLCLTRRQ